MHLYRVHWKDCPPLTADNAWSALWGTVRSADGAQTVCLACDGTGKGWTECPRCHGDSFDELFNPSCTRCDGNGFIEECSQCDRGWVDCVRGYSCTETPEDLISYFSGSRAGLADEELVIVFEGRIVDVGFDGEPTAIPDRVIETLTWEEFISR